MNKALEPINSWAFNLSSRGQDISGCCGVIWALNEPI
jgi:hypothetical protein